MTKTKIEKIPKSDFDELQDKYLRIYAEFENHKKRVTKEKEDIRNITKIETIAAILDVDSDLSIALKNEKSQGLTLIQSKVGNFLHSQGIDTIPTDKYDPDVHEVISVLEEGESIIDVVSKGYTLNGKIIRYPKVILGNK